MIIFINGSINSGKSTISKLLQKELGKTAVVEIDSLRAFIEWMPLEQAIPINLQNAASVIENFANQQLNVIVPYPLSKESHDYFLRELKDYQLIFLTLAPKLDIILNNRGNRELSKWEINRIKHHYQIGIHNPEFGTIIDNSNQTPEETLESIKDCLF